MKKLLMLTVIMLLLFLVASPNTFANRNSIIPISPGVTGHDFSIGGGFSTTISHVKIHGTYGKKSGLMWAIKIGGFSKSTSDDYYENISSSEANGWGDEIIDLHEYNNVASIGFYTRTIKSRESKSAFFYSTIDLLIGGQVEERYDEFHILGTNGHYYINEQNQYNVGLTAGIIFRGAITFDASVGKNNNGISIGFLF